MADETSHVGLDVQDFLSGIDKMIRKGQELNKTLRKGDLGAQQLVQGLTDLANEMKTLAAQQKNALDPKNFGKVLVILDKITQQLDEVTKATADTVQSLGQVGTTADVSLRKVATTTQKSVTSINKELKSVKDQTQLATAAVKQHRIEQERKIETASRTKSANDFIKGLRNTIATSYLTQAQTIKLEKTFAELSKEMVSGSKSIGQYETAVDRIFKGQARAISAHPKLTKIVQSIAELGQRATEVKARKETKTSTIKAAQEQAKVDAEIARIEEARNQEIEASQKRSYKRRTALISAHVAAFIASKGIEESKLKESELAKLNIQKASIARSLSLQKEIKVKAVPTLLGTMTKGIAPEGLITATKELNSIIALTERVNAPPKPDKRRAQQVELEQITELLKLRNRQALAYIEDEKLRGRATSSIQNLAKIMQQEGATAEQVQQGIIPTSERVTRAFDESSQSMRTVIDKQQKLNDKKLQTKAVDEKYIQILGTLNAHTNQVINTEALAADEKRKLQEQTENMARSLSTEKIAVTDTIATITDLAKGQNALGTYTQKTTKTFDTYATTLEKVSKDQRALATQQVVRQRFQIPTGIEATQTKKLLSLQEQLSKEISISDIEVDQVSDSIQKMLTPGPEADQLRQKYEKITTALDILVAAQQRVQRGITGPTQITQTLSGMLNQYQDLIGANEQLGVSARQTAQRLTQAYMGTGLRIEDFAENMDRIRRGEPIGEGTNKNLATAVSAWDKLLGLMGQAGRRSAVADEAMTNLTSKLTKFDRYSKDTRISLILLQKSIVDAFLKSGRPADSFAQTIENIRKGDKKLINDLPELSGAVRNFDRQVRSADTTLQGFTFSISNLSRLVVARIVTAVFYRLWNQMENTLQTAVDLSKAIGEIQTISQAASVSNDQWAASIRRVSDAYNFLQPDVAEGLYQTISNQVALGRDAMLFMEQAAPFAKATKSTMTETVELLSSVLNSYNMGVQDLDSVTSSLFRTIELGRVRASEMANTFGRIGGIAEVSGIQLNELLSTIVVLTRSGLKFERASTFILNVMNKLIKPSKEMQQLFNSWSVTSGQAALNVYGLTGVIDKLGSASEGMVGELAEDFRDLRAILGGITLVRNAEKFKSTIDSLSNSFEYYQNAVDIAMQSSGEIVTREIQQLKNEFTALSTFLLDTVAAFNKLNFVQGLGGLSGLTEGAVALGVAMGPAAILSFKYRDNIDRSKKALETMKLNVVDRTLTSIGASSANFAKNIVTTTTRLPLLNTLLMSSANTLTSIVSKLGLYVFAISAISEALIAVERRLFSVNVENTKFSKTMQDAAMHARKLMATLQPTKEQTAEREKQKAQLLALNKQELELHFTQKRLLESLDTEFKKRERLADQQKDYLQKIKDIASELETFQRESRWEQMLPLSKIVDQTDYLQLRLQEINKIIADPATAAQGPALFDEWNKVAKETYKNYLTLIKDMTRAEQLWQYAMMTGSKDAQGEATQILEKWRLTPMDFGPQLFASINAEKGRLENLMNEVMSPMFAAAGMSMPEGGIGEFGELSKSLQIIAEADRREKELEVSNNIQTEVRDFLKETLKGDIKSIQDILTASLALSTKGQAEIANLFGTDSVFVDIATQLMESRQTLKATQSQVINEMKGTAKQTADAFVKKFTTLSGPISQSVRTAKTIAEHTGNTTLTNQVATTEAFFAQLAQQPTVLKQPEMQDQMLRVMQDLTLATEAAIQQGPGILKTAWLTIADFVPGVSDSLDRYKGTLEALVPRMNSLTTETAINIRALREDKRAFATASLENMQAERKAITDFATGLNPSQLNAQVNNATINIANANLPGQPRATGGVINGPKGTDTVPAWLTPGEFVVNAEASKRNAPLLHAINAGYYAKGGNVIELSKDQLLKYKQLEKTLLGFEKEAWTPTWAVTIARFLEFFENPSAGISPGPGAIPSGAAIALVQSHTNATKIGAQILENILSRNVGATIGPGGTPGQYLLKSSKITRPIRIETKSTTSEKPTQDIGPNTKISSEFFAQLHAKLIPKYAVSPAIVRSWSLEDQYAFFGIKTPTDRLGKPIRSEMVRGLYKQPLAQRRLHRAYKDLEQNQQTAAQYTTIYQNDKGEVRVWDGYQDLTLAEYQWIHGQSPTNVSYTQTTRSHKSVKVPESLRGTLGRSIGITSTSKQIIKPNEVTADNVYSYANGQKIVVFNGQGFSKENFGKVFGEEALKVVEQKRHRDMNRASDWGTRPGNIRRGVDDLMYQWDGFNWRTEEEWKNLYTNKFAKGGHVGGPKGTDTVPAWLTPGEFVVNAKSAQRYGALLERLNSFGSNIAPMFRANGRGYATGGPVPTNNYQIKNDITLQSTGQETIDARRLVTAINREVYRGTLRVRTAQ
jgi:TP901 family phage tail tape measure protein